MSKFFTPREWAMQEKAMTLTEDEKYFMEAYAAYVSAEKDAEIKALNALLDKALERGAAKEEPR
jgi:hypothetical protein